MPRSNLGKYVYYTHTHPQTGKVTTGDMNWWEWERIQKDKYRAKWFTIDKIVDFNDNTPRVPTADAGRVHQLEVEEDSLECPLCGEVAKDEEGLRNHKATQHGKEKQSVSVEDTDGEENTG